MDQRMMVSVKKSHSHAKSRLWSVTRLIIFLLLIIDLMPVVVGQQKFGSLRLCPAGGRAFQMAWNLACDMKKRKRRSIVSDVAYFGTPLLAIDEPLQRQTKLVKRGDYRPATLTDIMQICCEVGCEIRDLLAYCDPFGSWNS